ncbi:MAG: TonB-dependent receptor [Hyphomonadaceae bacterium]|nr:TonB-dependent receptor [Hyphomonadaceae bacterium]
MRSRDSDGVVGEFGHLDGVTDFDIFSQEFRLQSNGDQRFDWLLGVNYSRDELTESRFFLARDNVFLASAFGLYGVTSPSELVTRFGYDQTSESYAIFGQFGYAFDDQWSIDLGLRYTEESKDYENSGLNFPLGTGPVSPFVGVNANFQLSDSHDLKENLSVVRA